LTKELSDVEIIKLSMLLLSDKDAKEIREDAQVLLMKVHDRSSDKPSWHKPMFGEAMSYELLYKLGRWLNKEYPEG